MAILVHTTQGAHSCMLCNKVVVKDGRRMEEGRGDVGGIVAHG